MSNATRRVAPIKAIVSASFSVDFSPSLAFRHCQHNGHDGDEHHEYVEGECDNGCLADREAVLTPLESDNAFEPVNSRRIGPESGENSRGNRYAKRGTERRSHLIDAGPGAYLATGQA